MLCIGEGERCGSRSEPEHNILWASERREQLKELRMILKNVFLAEYIDGAACYIDVGSSYPGRAEVYRVQRAYAQ